MPPARSLSTSRILRMGNLCPGMPRSLFEGTEAMLIRRSPNGAGHIRPQHSRDRSEQVIAINRNAWSQSIGTGGRNHPVRATLSGLPHRHTSSGHGTGIGDGIGRGIDVAATEGWRKRHDSGAVAARYRHAFGGLSVRFLVGQSVRNPADLQSFRPWTAVTEAHLFLAGRADLYTPALARHGGALARARKGSCTCGRCCAGPARRPTRRRNRRGSRQAEGQVVHAGRRGRRGAGVAPSSFLRNWRLFIVRRALGSAHNSSG